MDDQSSTVKDPDQGFRWSPLDLRHNKRIYHLTGPNAVDGGYIAHIIGGTMGQPEFKFEPVSRSEMKKELERFHDLFFLIGEAPESLEDFIRRHCEDITDNESLDDFIHMHSNEAENGDDELGHEDEQEHQE
ncbi:hypothetical protein BC938DRAFT_480916 [Jimgerdemannia flammicorona]|uniref:Uncharacterized protein n=1 Tax=Jimgerdemannia flammicorona TaxID=994334 RepID=A0A433QHD6_9FUNG|nr:hypothetical protein BC938DRAFT_480916 [Jimgerdemannia flammicorona]